MTRSLFFSTFGTEMFVLFWDVFVLSQVLLLKDIGNSHQEGPVPKIIQPKLATLFSKKADGYQDRSHVLFLTRRTLEN